MKRLLNLIVSSLFIANMSLAQGPLHRVGNGELCAYADSKGKVVIPKGKYISSCPKIKSPVLLQSATSDSCFWVDANGVELYSVYMLGDRVDNLNGGRMRVERMGKVGYVDKKGSLVIPIEYSLAERFVGKYALVSKSDLPTSSTDDSQAPIIDGLWGVIDKKGKEVKPVVYRKMWSPNLSCIVYMSDKEGFYLTDKGKIVEIPFSE